MNTPDSIDANLDAVLFASGSRLKHYMPATVEKMREAMRKVMSDSYIAGSNDHAKALRASGQIE